MAIEPFFGGAAAYNEHELALNLGLLYKSTSSVISVALAANPVYFIFDGKNAKELIHFAQAFSTSGPGLVTLFGPSETANISNVGNVIDSANQRVDILTPANVILYENSIIANVGTNKIHSFHIGILKETGGGRESEGGDATSSKTILSKEYPFIVEFSADFDVTDCQWETAFFEKDPRYKVGQSE